MVHVLEDMRESKCPVPDVAMPPAAPQPRLLPAARSRLRLGNVADALQETIDYVAITRLLLRRTPTS